MPDDLAELADEITKELNMGDAIGPLPEEPKFSELPRAKIHIPDITQLWIRWMPLSILFFGLSFTAWTVIQVTMIGRYHDALGRVEHRVKVLEDALVKAKKGQDVEYWSHQCAIQVQRGDYAEQCKRSAPPDAETP